MGNRFKIGDKVRGKALNCTTITGIVVGLGSENGNFKYAPNDAVWAYWTEEGKKSHWHPTYLRESQVELIETISNRFEVGKKYIYKENPSANVWFEVLFVTEKTALIRYEDTTECARDHKHFYKYVEYIPPPPEEWRALYWRPNSKPEISAAYWDSKSKCETYHNDDDLPLGERNFMYAIRTDINAKENK